MGVVTIRGVNEQPRLIPPPQWALGKARAAVRLAQERALTAKPTPAPMPGWSPSASHPAGTVTEVPRGPVPGPAPPHGTRARYNNRAQPCRCTKCRTANTRYIAAYRGRVRAEDRTAAVSVAATSPAPGPATLVR